MAKFLHIHEKKKIFFTDHSLDRFWERCKENDVHGRQQALNHLRKRLADATWFVEIPSWTKVSDWNRERADGFLSLDENSGFVVNKNPSGDRVAVTYLENLNQEKQ